MRPVHVRGGVGMQFPGQPPGSARRLLTPYFSSSEHKRVTGPVVTGPLNALA